jgi:hypothetical protein
MEVKEIGAETLGCKYCKCRTKIMDSSLQQSFAHTRSRCFMERHSEHPA